MNVWSAGVPAGAPRGGFFSSTSPCPPHPAQASLAGPATSTAPRRGSSGMRGDAVSTTSQMTAGRSGVLDSGEGEEKEEEEEPVVVVVVVHGGCGAEKRRERGRGPQNPRRRGGRFEETAVFVAALKDCAKRKDLGRGRRIHGELRGKGGGALMREDMYLGSALVDMYAKCGAMAEAQGAFEELAARDVVTWNALIGGYARLNRGDEAISCSEKMKGEGISPDAFTYVCLLKACGSMDQGREIHGEIADLVGRGSIDAGNVVLNTALLDMYAGFGDMAEARRVFDRGIALRNVVAWTALIAGYARRGDGAEALDCFKLMLEEGIPPDAFAFASALSAVGSTRERRAAKEGLEVHARIASSRGDMLLGRSVVVQTALVDMYAKCGFLAMARDAFDRLPVRNVVTWAALISGYTRHGLYEEAMDCFEAMMRTMRHERSFIPVNEAIFVCLLKACAHMGAIDKGREVHALLVGAGLLDPRNEIVGTSLVDMYAKCGDLGKACQMFDRLSCRSIISWTALIAGYAHIGAHDMVCNTFDRMIADGIAPNLVTFTVVLNACNHLGLLEKGEAYFAAMGREYGIEPTAEHLTCVVDLFGRAGHLEKAAGIVEATVGFARRAHRPLWTSLLGSCQKWGDVELARRAFEHLAQLDESMAPEAYVSMSNVYALSLPSKERPAGKIIGHREQSLPEQEETNEEGR